MKNLAALLLLFLLPADVIAQNNCIQIARDHYRNSEYALAIEVLNACPPELKNEVYAELLASSYFHSGDLKSAYREVKLIPDSSSSQRMLVLKARISYSRADYSSAYNYYKQLVQIDSLNSTYMRQLASSADKIDSLELAISYYRKALDLNPNDLVTGTLLLEKYIKLDKMSVADSLSEKLIAVDSLPILLRLRGDILYRWKDYPKAWECYEPLLKNETSDPVLLRKAGVCKFVMGEKDSAITFLSKSFLKAPEDEVTCYYLGLAYHAKADYKTAEMYFKSAISNAISQNISNYYQRMADTYEASGNYAKALDSFQAAIKYQEDNSGLKPELNYQVGRMYEIYFEDYKSAIKYYERFLNTYTDTTETKYVDVKTRKESLEKQVK